MENRTDITEPFIEHRLGWKKTVFYSLLPLLVLLGLCELGAVITEHFSPIPPEDFTQGFTADSRLFVPHPDKPGIMTTNPAKEKNFAVQRFQNPKPDGTIRIFAVGGSSVRYLWWDLLDLQKRLSETYKGKVAFEVIDAGGLSYGSHRLVLIVKEIMEYEPDLVLFYEAHNEFEELDQLKLGHPENARLRKLLDHSASWRRIRYWKAQATISRLEKEHNSLIMANPDPNTVNQKAWAHEFSGTEIESRMAEYRNNLEIMIQTCGTHGVPFVIGTVPSNLIKPALYGKAQDEYKEVWQLFEKKEWARGATLGREILSRCSRHQSSNVENGIIRDLAVRYGIPLADVEAAIIEAEPDKVPGQTLFMDHCHLNPTGNRILIKTYEPYIHNVLKTLTGAADHPTP